MNELFQRVHDSLPIFKIDFEQYTALYTPGFSLKVNSLSKNEICDLLKNPESIKDVRSRNLIFDLLLKAQEAINNWESKKSIPFSPECLTIHVGSDCNLNCSYCYAKIAQTGNKNIIGFPNNDAISIVCNYITKSIKAQSGKLTVAFHGAGEPTFHWQQLIDSYKTVTTIAKQNNVQIFTYLATNGSLTREQVDWLAKNISLIGISCDGPVVIQQKQRPSKSEKTLPIEEVCSRIIEKKGRFDIRVTITKETITQLTDISKYLIEKLNAKNIRVEPVYLASNDGFKKEDADTFFKNYTEASKYVKQYGVNMSYAGVRMDEQHGTYCDVLRNTIRLTADGLSRNCFCFMKDNKEFLTGKYDKNLSVFELSPDINELKNKALQLPKDCFNCINIYHCSRGCPDFCAFDNEYSGHQYLNPFRCRLHQLLTIENIKDSLMIQIKS